MSSDGKGRLIVIGGHESWEEEAPILSAVAQAAGTEGGALVLVTVATYQPEKVAADYREVFGKFGIGQVNILDIRDRTQAFRPDHLALLERARVVFFSGGDQLRISSQLGGTPILVRIHEIFEEGGTIVGTSAGAAAMPETMMIYGRSEQSLSLNDLYMAPGLGFISRVVIDSHFAERGRVGRLLLAVAQNPYNMGLGIDEDTAVVVENKFDLRVVGSGGVYIVDGQKISYSSMSERHPSGVVAIFGAALHLLGDGDRFNLQSRIPTVSPQEREVAEESSVHGQ